MFGYKKTIEIQVKEKKYMELKFKYSIKITYFPSWLGKFLNKKEITFEYVGNPTVFYKVTNNWLQRCNTLKEEWLCDQVTGYLYRKSLNEKTK